MNIQILIQNGDMVFVPAVVDGIQWTTERKSTPGKLTFTAVNDGNLNVEEGNAVKMVVDETNVFFGYIFTKPEIKTGRYRLPAMISYGISKIRTHTVM